MEYLLDNHKFNLNYSQLKEDFEDYSNLPDEQFIAKIPEILHFICILSYLKELPAICLVGDTSLMHELIHILNGIETVQTLKEIRKLFDILMELK